MTICPKCSVENDDDRLRCSQCGAMLRDVDRVTRKIRREDVLGAAKLHLERSAKPSPAPAPPAPPPSPPPRAPAAPPPPPPPPTIVLDWTKEGALVSGVLESPYPLQRTTTVSIGRTEENNIVMPVHQVSRRHAIVKWDGEGFAVVDRNSTNGTYVNGEPVQRRRLRPGDKISIGPFELVFHQGPGAPGPFHDESTVVVAIPGAFSGELAEVSVAEICQLIELNQKTGVLAFHVGERRGKLYFAAGRAVHAEYLARLGDEAALELLLLTKGSFRFFARASVGVETTIKRSTGSLLLEAARRLDESTERGPPLE